MFDEGLKSTLGGVLIALAVLGFALAIAAAVFITVVALRHAFDRVDSDQTPGPYVVIGLDLSQGNPLVTDRVFAERVGDRLFDMIANLRKRSDVRVRGFGDYGRSPAQLSFDRRITLRPQAERFAGTVRAVVTSLPDLMDESRLRPTSESNILAFLEGMADGLDCQNRQVHIYLVTDGIEDSEFASMETAQSTLPSPPRALFEGCYQLQMVGLGQGQDSPLLGRQLRNQWEGWAEAAGFEDFVSLSNW